MSIFQDCVVRLSSAHAATAHTGYEMLEGSKHNFWRALHEMVWHGEPLVPYGHGQIVNNSMPIWNVLLPFMEVLGTFTLDFKRKCNIAPCAAEIRYRQTFSAVMVYQRTMAADNPDYAHALPRMSAIVRHAIRRERPDNGQLCLRTAGTSQPRFGNVNVCPNCDFRDNHANDTIHGVQLSDMSAQLFVQLPALNASMRQQQTITPVLDTKLSLTYAGRTAMYFLDCVILWPNENHYNCVKYIHGHTEIKTGWYRYDGLIDYNNANAHRYARLYI